MQIAFTKFDRRYEIAVDRTAGHALEPRNGPGFDDAVPHDVAHLFVEIEECIAGGVYGRLAAADGDDGLFWAADPTIRRKAAKRRRPPTPAESADMARSERLASLTVALWEVSTGRRRADDAWPGTEASSGIDQDLLRRLYARYDEFARIWEMSGPGESVVIAWPFAEGSGTRRRR